MHQQRLQSDKVAQLPLREASSLCSVYLPTTLVVQVEQSVPVCVCLSECPDNNLWTKWTLTQMFDKQVQLDII